MAWTLLDSGGATLNAAGSGQSFSFPGGAASAGDLLTLEISSDTTVSTPSGWSSAVSDVGNIGAYIFYKVAAGGETSVTVTTSGSFPTALGYLRYSTPTATPLDVTAAGRSTVSGSSTPSATTGALATTGELSIAAACLGGLQGSTQTGVSWSTGYTNRIDQTSGGNGSTDQHVFAADNRNAGTAAESPSASWTGATNNQTLLVATFKPAATTSTLPQASRRRAAAPAVARRPKASTPARAQLTPPYQPPAVHRTRHIMGRLRGRVALFAPPQVVVPPPPYVPPTVHRTRQVLGRVRGRSAAPVPPQVVIVPPAYPPQPVYKRLLAFVTRRGRAEAPPLVVDHLCVTPRPNTGTTAYNTATTARPNSGTTQDPC